MASQDSVSVIRSAAEQYNRGEGGATNESVGGGTQYEILHATADGPRVSFAYLVKQGRESQAYGTGVAYVEGGKITSLQRSTNYVTQVGGAPSLTGNWSGSAQGITVVLVLTQNADNSVTGTATAFGSTFPVTGNVSYPSVSLKGDMNGVEVSFQGKYDPPPNTIPGTLTALGSSLPVTMTRQS